MCRDTEYRHGTRDTKEGSSVGVSAATGVAEGAALERRVSDAKRRKGNARVGRIVLRMYVIN